MAEAETKELPAGEAKAAADEGSSAKRRRVAGEEEDIYFEMTKAHAKMDNIESCNFESAIPEATKTKPCWMGIDEAGRGPVCGPMTYGAAWAPIEEEPRLNSMGFADSKQLTEEKRDKLFKAIKAAPEFIGWMVSVLSASDISVAMLGRVNYNLNAMSHDTAIQMIQRVLDQGVNLKEVYVDTVGIEEKYQAKLELLFPDLDITVTKKADDKFKICGAASICAKVTRDQIIERWAFIEPAGLSCEMGSGYPGDPITKKWFATAQDKVFGYPTLVRFSWSTTKKAMLTDCVPVTWEDDGDSDDDGSTPSVMTFFAKKDGPKKRHRFFHDRGLSAIAGDF